MGTTQTVINHLVPELNNSTEVTLDSLYVEISTIKDTLASVSQHTAPTSFLGLDSGLSNSWIGLVAMIVGFIAAYYGYKGFKYQKIASEELKSMVPKRIPLLPFLKKLYDNTIIFRLIYDYSIPLSDEGGHNQVELEVDFERNHLPWESLMLSAMLQESLFDLSKYEKYSDRNIYISAIEMRLRWKEYNSEIKIAIDELKSGKVNLQRCFELIHLTETNARYIMGFDDMICKAEESQFNIPYEKNQLETDFKEIITCHFLALLHDVFSLQSNITHERVMRSTFCDDGSNVKDVFLSSIKSRKDSKPESYDPLTIKTCLLRPDIPLALKTLSDIHNAVESIGKKDLTIEEYADRGLKRNIDETLGEECSIVLNNFYNSGALRFNDIVGYDVYLRVCQYKGRYLDYEHLRKIYDRYEVPEETVEPISGLSVQLEEGKSLLDLLLEDERNSQS